MLLTEEEYPPLVRQHIRMIRDLREVLTYYRDCADQGVLPTRGDLLLLADAALLDAREPLVPHP